MVGKSSPDLVVVGEVGGAARPLPVSSRTATGRWRDAGGRRPGPGACRPRVRCLGGRCLRGGSSAVCAAGAVGPACTPTSTALETLRCRPAAHRPGPAQGRRLVAADLARWGRGAAAAHGVQAVAPSRRAPGRDRSASRARIGRLGRRRGGQKQQPVSPYRPVAPPISGRRRSRLDLFDSRVRLSAHRSGAGSNGAWPALGSCRRCRHLCERMEVGFTRRSPSRGLLSIPTPYRPGSRTPSGDMPSPNRGRPTHNSDQHWNFLWRNKREDDANERTGGPAGRWCAHAERLR